MFSGNAARGNVLAGNSIGGSLVCTGSSVAASDNKVKGRSQGQCG